MYIPLGTCEEITKICSVQCNIVPQSFYDPTADLWAGYEKFSPGLAQFPKSLFSILYQQNT